ncbi:Protein kinase-like domain protein [Cordyceps fumosorosea ARSEF 2679]|uniref:Protein kinase-like domain protein n=1 Tax=Cordyceps fumosorosea (strain ARSEF 2679) TaxID=1081104 RepID=A0A168CK84_CORFA|nr:Protein kinase-like domain protein [Cordyceps fumosorosea ARSEF 2679]OAA71480.1 Protein kinase-like domain protein [Cordyceps fumosorosea ARSEF 2679]
MASEVSLNVAAVLDLAASLRPGPCTACQVMGTPLYGSFNKVLIVRFDDGLKWIFRTPRRDKNGQNLPPRLLKALIGSEVTTLNFLARHSTVPVPRVLAYSVGVPYILMTCALGQSFSAFMRRMQNASSRDKLHATTKVMKQLGEMCFEMSKLRFEKIGSIQERDGRFGLGEMHAPAFIFQDRHSIIMDRGPFSREQDYYKALSKAFFGHVHGLSMSHHFFWGPFPELPAYPDPESHRIILDRWNDFVTVDDKIESSENRVQYHTAGTLVEDIIPQLCASQTGMGFPLGHADLSSSNIFVDESCNITCIIDWEFASTMPLGQLLTAPGLPNQRRLPSAAELVAFRTGFEAAAGNTIVEPRIPWILTDVLWHYMRWVHLDTGDDYRHFEALFSLHPEFAARDPLLIIDELQGSVDIQEARQYLKAREREPDEIKRDEDWYFGVTDEGPRQRRIAEILTKRFWLRRQILGPRFWMETLREDFRDPEESSGRSNSDSRMPDGA